MCWIPFDGGGRARRLYNARLSMVRKLKRAMEGEGASGRLVRCGVISLSSCIKPRSASPQLNGSGSRRAVGVVTNALAGVCAVWF